MTTEELNKARDDKSMSAQSLAFEGEELPQPQPSNTSVEFETLQQRIAALEADVAFLRTYHAWPTKS